MIAVHCAAGRSPIGRIGSPPTAYGAIVVTYGGSDMDAAADATPGIVSSAGIRRVMNDRIAAGSAYFDVGSETRIAARPAGPKPTGTCSSRVKL